MAHCQTRSLSNSNHFIIKMSYCLLVCLILTVQLVGEISSVTESTTGYDEGEPGDTSDYPVITEITTILSSRPRKEPQDNPDQCAWWCNEFYGIIALATAGTVLLISIILFVVSCCLWKRIKHSKQEDERCNNTVVKSMELDVLGSEAAADSSKSFPVPEETPAMNDVEPSDVGNCISNAEIPLKETPQDAEDQTADGPAVTFPPPENIPILP